MITLFQIFILLFISVIFLYKTWYKPLENARKEITKWLPAAPRIPILGSAFEFGNQSESLNNFYRLTNNSCKSVFFDIAGEWTILTRDYDLIEFILSSTTILKKPRMFEYLLPWLGDGLVLSNGAKWKSHRKALNPTFSLSILEQFVDVFSSKGDILIEKLKSNVLNKDKVDTYEYLSPCALDIICETAMGSKINCQINEDNGEYLDAIRDMLTVVINRTYSIWKSNEFLFKFSKDYKSQCRVLRIIHSLTNSVIKQRKKELEITNNDNVELTDSLGRKRKITFLDLLLSHQSFTDEEIRDEVDTFMAAGHDTTASAMASSLYVLSKEQKVQNLVRDELKQVIGENRDRPITFQDLNEMKYLDLVVKEILRMYPPVPLIGRLTEKDIIYNGNIIPKNTNIMLFVFGINRDPDYHKDPEVFNPERFLDTSNKKPYSNIPFSSGPRNCIGQKFALLEMKTMISKILMNFHILPTDPLQEPILVTEVDLKILNGHVQFRKINWHLNSRTENKETI